MRIVKKIELLQQKEGTIFSFYKDKTFGSLGVFISARHEDDFNYISPTALDCHTNDEEWVLEDAEENGVEFGIDHTCCESEGDFDNTKLYAIWDENDVKKLKDLINKYHP